ncbi:hypothetical protein, partial [uncultured Alistipes sp.]|uniref:hypothetical protein n=1 Tax=uncultured Alistipes sp. TaxID=538949 RepID=UPI00272FA819
RAQPCQGWGREFESRFPLRGLERNQAIRSKKPYVSMICKVFSFLGAEGRSNEKQVFRAQFVTCFRVLKNRSRFVHIALVCIILRRNIFHAT